MPVSPDTSLGRYMILSLLGTGGMGEVYLAEDTQLHRKVAVKVLPAEFVESKDRLERFEREAFTASSLNHPNILTIHEIGSDDGHYFIATEYIEGESLRDLAANGGLSMHEMLEIGVQTASALAAAHAAGITHRDIKPENIMVRRDGIVKVLDFGLAKLSEKQQETVPAASEAPTRHNTAPGVVMGTATYMSPEQARGKDVDTRTDIWSLGVVLYEMAAGVLPFRGETMTDTLGLIMHKEPLPLVNVNGQLPAELDRIVTKALTKDKENRYQVVKDLGIDLKSLKRNLDFDAERERTGAPDRFTHDGHASTAAISAQFSAPQMHSTSSAEFIATGIMRHKFGFAAVAVILIAAIAGLGYFYLGRSAQPPINSVAVLPFVNTGGDPNFEYISDGLSEGVINNLSQLPQLKVIARSSSFKYRGKDIDVDEVSKALGVGAVVMGRVLQRGDDLLVSVELVNAADKTQIFGEQFTRKVTDLQSLQSLISKEIAEKLRLRLTGDQQQKLDKKPTQDAEAYRLYLDARANTLNGGNETIKKALDQYSQAATRDPNFALAHLGIAYCYRFLATNGVLNPKEALEKGKASLAKALALDDGLAEAHYTLGLYKDAELDLQGAGQEYRRAIELDPNNASAHSIYGSYLICIGRSDDGLAEIRRGMDLDPLRTSYKRVLASNLYIARRFDEAIVVLQDYLKTGPDAVGHSTLGYAFAAKGQYADAIAEYQRSMDIDGENTSDLCYLGAAYAGSGKRKEALDILEKLKTTKEYVSPTELAALYISLDDKEEAFRSLEQAYAARDSQLKFLKVEPDFDPLRSDPRFADLMRRVGFPE